MEKQWVKITGTAELPKSANIVEFHDAIMDVVERYNGEAILITSPDENDPHNKQPEVDNTMKAYWSSLPDTFKGVTMSHAPFGDRIPGIRAPWGKCYAVCHKDSRWVLDNPGVEVDVKPNLSYYMTVDIIESHGTNSL